MKSNYIEIQRNNVTVNEFLTYVATKLAKKNMVRGFSPEDFTNPGREYLSSYTVVGDKKHCHFAENGHRFDQIWDATDAPCKAETVKQFAYNLQTYILNWDGTCFNEACEFTFDDDKRGWGYYYQASVWNEE